VFPLEAAGSRWRRFRSRALPACICEDLLIVYEDAEFDDAEGEYISRGNTARTPPAIALPEMHDVFS